MKIILKTTEEYEVSKWISDTGKESYAVMFFDEMKYIRDENGNLVFNHKFRGETLYQRKSRILQPYEKIKKYLEGE